MPTTPIFYQKEHDKATTLSPISPGRKLLATARALDVLVGSVHRQGCSGCAAEMYLTRAVWSCYDIGVVSVDERSCQKTKEVQLMTLHNTETR